MKIALIAAETQVRDGIFPLHLMQTLAQHGELSVNHGGNTLEDIKPVLKNADIIITSWSSPRLTADYLDEAPNCKLIIHAAGSVKGIASDEVWKRGIRVISSANVNGYNVAETTLGMCIAASKEFFHLNEHVHAGGWGHGKWKVVDLVDITIGVIGGGMAGMRFIQLLTNFEVDVLLYDPYLPEEAVKGLARKVSLEELLKTSDIVSVHAPSIPETNNMINKETLKLMKKDAGLINTARGSIINEQDLYEHMRDGNLRFACLDVMSPEPPVKDNPLLSLDNVIVTPHIAGIENNSLIRIGRHVIRELIRYENGEPSACEFTHDMMSHSA